jgi:SAM-dependent methyltransferase
MLTNTGCSLSVAEVSRFIRTHDGRFDGQLSQQLNYSRVVSLAHFEALLGQFDLSLQAHVGIISGSLAEPELPFLKPDRTTVLSFEVDPAYDLDRSWLAQPSQGFSFTLCNQTLEHVFNPHCAVKNLIHHTAPGGHIYVSIPTVNCIHGEPYFFSSGFHPRYLERLGNDAGLEVVNIGSWGSYKYLINAVSGTWLPEAGLRRGVVTGRALQHLGLVFQDGRINQPKYITDCWALFRRPTA